MTAARALKRLVSSSPVAEVIRAMRDAAASGEPVSPETAQKWATQLMTSLYSKQRAVRWECRSKLGNGVKNDLAWREASASDITYWPERKLEIRGLYLHPPAPKAFKDHRFQDGTCLDCNVLEWMCDPDCHPLPPEPTTHRLAALPFNPEWLIEPLQLLRTLSSKHLAQSLAKKWDTETTFLIDQINDHLKDNSR